MALDSNKSIRRGGSAWVQSSEDLGIKIETQLEAGEQQLSSVESPSSVFQLTIIYQLWIVMMIQL